MSTTDRQRLEGEAERLGLLGAESLDDDLLYSLVGAYQMIEFTQSSATNESAPSAIIPKKPPKEKR